MLMPVQVTAYVTYVPAPTTIVHGDLSFVATTVRIPSFLNIAKSVAHMGFGRDQRARSSADHG